MAIFSVESLDGEKVEIMRLTVEETTCSNSRKRKKHNNLKGLHSYGGHHGRIYLRDVKKCGTRVIYRLDYQDRDNYDNVNISSGFTECHVTTGR